MLPIEVEHTNHNFGPPPGQEENIGSLPCEKVTTEAGTYYYSVWEPSDAERQAIAHGQNVRLGIGWIGGFPPVSLGVTPEGYEHEQKAADA